jgi:uncharacterized membrane protein (UPF0127 family)
MDSPVKLRGPSGVVAHRVHLATSLRDRRQGVLGRDPLAPDEAMVLRPCHQVHTMGVPYPLDAIFCDRRDRVLHVETLQPGRVSRYVWRARYCVELLGGRAEECGVVRGATLSFAEAT